MTPPRPAADAVLRAMLADGFCPHTHGADGRVRIMCASSMMVLDVPKMVRTPWAQESPAAALEALVARDLWPWPTEGAYVVRWWSVTSCPLCAAVPDLGARCVVCEGTLWAPVTFEATPPSEHAVVAVASLGAAALLRAAALADALAPRSTVVWWVRPREGIEAAHRLLSGQRPLTLPSVFAAESCRGWRKHCTWNRDDIRAAWPALREIAMMGLHLTGCQNGYVTLCVEDLL